VKYDRRVRFATVGGSDWFYTLEDDNAVIWRGENDYNNKAKPAVHPVPNGDVNIPAELDGHPVVAIGSQAFFGCKNMTSITVPEGVTRIDGRAFYGCSGLVRIDLPESLRTVRSGAFDYCRSLAVVDLKHCKEFDGSSLKNCPSLAEVKVGKDMPGFLVNGGALYADSGRRLVFWPRMRDEIALRDGVETIGRSAFQGCSIRRVVLPKSVRVVEAEAFSMCKELRRVELGEGVVEVGNEAFEFCSNLQTVVIPASVRKIGYGLFERDNNLRRIIFKGNAPMFDEVGRNSVLGKTSEALEILVPEGTTGWKEPGSAELPKLWPYEKMEDSRPIKAVSEKELQRLVDEQDGVADDGIHTSKANGYAWKYKSVAGGVEITACESDKAKICAVEPRPTGTLRIPSRLDGKPVVGIGGWAFARCKSIKNVEIPEGVLTLRGWGVFFGCEALESVSFPASIREVSAKETFVNCRSLKVLKFLGQPPRVESQGNMNYDKMIFRGASEGCVVSVPPSAKGWGEKWPADFDSGRKVVRGNVGNVGRADANKTSEGTLPSARTKEEVEALLKRTRIKVMSFKTTDTIADVVEFFRSELGLNFCLRVGKSIPQMPTLTASDIAARDALKLACDAIDYKYEVHNNIVVIFPKGLWSTLKWTPVPKGQTGQLLRDTRLPKLLVRPPMTVVDFVDMMRTAIRVPGQQKDPVNWVVSTERDSTLPALPTMALRDVSAWDAIDLVCQSCAMGVQVEDRTVIIKPLSMMQDGGTAKDAEPASRLSPQQMKNLADANGWNAMRKTTEALFDGWRICDSLRSMMTEADVRRNVKKLGYLRSYLGRGDVLKTVCRGDLLETRSIVAIRPGSALRFCVHAPTGTRIILHDGVSALSNRQSKCLASYVVTNVGWQEATISLDKFAGQRLRLRISVWGQMMDGSPVQIHWSDLRIVQGE